MITVFSLTTPVYTRRSILPAQPRAPLPAPRFGASLLQDERYTFDFSMPVTDKSVAVTSHILQKMAAEKKALKDTGSVKLVIHSPGGSVSHGFKLLAVIRQLDVPIDTVVMGMAASMGAAISLGAASKGRRFMDRYAKLMIHQPSVGELGGTSEEIDNYNNHLKQTRNIMDGLISQSTGLSIEKVREMTSRDTYIYPLQALKLGFADWVLMQGNKGLNRDSVKGLSDADVQRRDQFNQYDDLPQTAFDPMPSNPKMRSSMMMEGEGGGDLSGLRRLLGKKVFNTNITPPAPTQETTRHRLDNITARVSLASRILPQNHQVVAAPIRMANRAMLDIQA